MKLEPQPLFVVTGNLAAYERFRVINPTLSYVIPLTNVKDLDKVRGLSAPLVLLLAPWPRDWYPEWRPYLLQARCQIIEIIS